MILHTIQPEPCYYVPTMSILPGATHSSYTVMFGGVVRASDTCQNEFIPHRINIEMRNGSTVIIADIGPAMSINPTTIAAEAFVEQAIALGMKVRRVNIRDVAARLSRVKPRQAMINAYGEPGTVDRPGPTHRVTGNAWMALAVADFAMAG